jgi:hypothetical protein
LHPVVNMYKIVRQFHGKDAYPPKKHGSFFVETFIYFQMTLPHVKGKDKYDFKSFPILYMHSIFFHDHRIKDEYNAQVENHAGKSIAIEVANHLRDNEYAAKILLSDAIAEDNTTNWCGRFLTVPVSCGRYTSVGVWKDPAFSMIRRVLVSIY